MKIKKHGMSIGLERCESEFFISLKAIGKLTHEDYQTLIPIIESALERVICPKINALIDATEFEGWELRAAWDDFIFGLKHHNEFNKIAIIGNEDWQEVMAKIGNWFTNGEIKYFFNTEEALDWLSKA